MSGAAGILGEIVEHTRVRVDARRRQVPLDRILSETPIPRARRDFASAIARTDRINVIAEFKRRSPSKGVLRTDLKPAGVAQMYEMAGASALSVLTEEKYFSGNIDDLQRARSVTHLPTLRKDFIVDSYQIWESQAAGADALLLIVAILSDTELRALLATTVEAGLEALVEVHDAEELARALGAGACIVGVNNRNLSTFEVSLDVSLNLGPGIPDDVVAVAESGIASAADIQRLRDAGFDAFLVGEHLMRASDPAAALAALTAGDTGRRLDVR